MNWYQRQKKEYESKRPESDEQQIKERKDNEVHAEELNNAESIHQSDIGIQRKAEKWLGNITNKRETEAIMGENKMNDGNENEWKASTVGEHTELVGDLNTDDDLIIYGCIKGNIKCSRSIQLYGSVEGDIICQEAVVVKASINGNVECKNTLKISQETKVEGNIITASLENGGSIHGDVIASDVMRLSSESQIIGDIEAGSISVEQGACIQGNIVIGAKVDMPSGKAAE